VPVLGVARGLVRAHDLEALADEDVMGPVDADVVDLVLAVAQLDHAVDDGARIGGQRRFGRLGRCRSADARPEPSRSFAGTWPSCFVVAGAPRLKAMTLDGENVADPPSAGCTTTCVAVIVVPLVVPSTRTGLPLVIALAEVYAGSRATGRMSSDGRWWSTLVTSGPQPRPVGSAVRAVAMSRGSA
jgi:hypothetical protein